MAIEIDQLRTVLIVTGAMAYRTALRDSAHSISGFGDAHRRINNILADVEPSTAAAAQAYRHLLAGQIQLSQQGTVLVQSWQGQTLVIEELTVAELQNAAATELQATAQASAAITAYGLQLAATAAAIAIAGVITATAAGVFATKSITEAYSEFESVMIDVQIRAEATREELRSLSGLALSQDMVELGKAGNEAAATFKRLAAEEMSVNEIRQASIPVMRATILLEQAEDDGARLMVNLMNQFKLTAADMPEIADDIAGAIKHTSLQGNEMAESLKYVGASAGELGWSLTETLAVLDPLVATLGRGEMAGTYLREVFGALKRPTDQAAFAFKQAGLDVNDFGKYSGSATKLLEWLQSGAWDATLITRAFGLRAGEAATILLNQYVPAIGETARKSHEAGAAQDLVRQKIESVDGAAKGLQAAWTNLKIAVGAFKAEDIMKVAQGFTRALVTIKEYVDKVRTEVEKRATASIKTHTESSAKAFGMYSSNVRKETDKANEAVKGHTDLVHESAVLLVKVLATASTGMLYLSGAIAYQTSVWFLLAAGIAKAIEEISSFTILSNYINPAYWAARLAGWDWNEFLGNTRDAARSAASSYWDASKALLHYATTDVPKAVNEIDKARDQLLETLKAKQLIDPLNDIVEREKARLRENKPHQEKDNITETGTDSAKQVLDALIEGRKQLNFEYEKTAALLTDDVEKARLEYEFRQKDLEYARAIYEITSKIKDIEKEDIDSAMGDWRSAYVDYLQAYTDLSEAIRKAQEKAAKEEEKRLKELDKARKESAREYVNQIKKATEIEKAIQMVIGGRLSETAKLALNRLTGSGKLGVWKMAIDPKSIRGAGSNKIILELQLPGGIKPPDDVAGTVMEFLLPVLKEAANRTRR